MRKVLLVSHSAARTGAPMVLLHFARWLVEERGVMVRTVLMGDGELMSGFRAVGPVCMLWDLEYPKSPLGGYGPARPWLLPPVRRRRIREWAGDVDVILLNSAAAADAARVLGGCEAPMVMFVHELERGLQAYVRPEAWERALERVDGYVACCAEVGRAVRQRVGELVPVDVVHEFIALPKVEAEKDSGLRELIGAAPGELLVGASGTVDLRKGADLFCSLFRAVERRYKELGDGRGVHFVWIGACIDTDMQAFVLADAQKKGLKGKVHFIGARSNVHALMADLDIFVLPSREDPFPLVCLEASALGKPLVCFDYSGGMPEFVNNGCGVVVPYLDLEEMADAIVRLAFDAELRRRLGERGRELVAREHSVEAGGLALWAVLEKHVRHGRRRSLSAFKGSVS